MNAIERTAADIYMGIYDRTKTLCENAAAVEKEMEERIIDLHRVKKDLDIDEIIERCGVITELRGYARRLWELNV